MLIISIAIVIIIIIIIIIIINIIIIITVITISIIIAFVKSAAHMLNQTTTSCNYCVLGVLTSNLCTCFFIYLFFVQKATTSYQLKWLGLFNKY